MKMSNENVKTMSNQNALTFALFYAAFCGCVRLYCCCCCEHKCASELYVNGCFYQEMHRTFLKRVNET